MGELRPSNRSRRPTRHEPKRLWNSAETNSSCNRTFSAVAAGSVRFKEVPHGGSNFDDVCFQREMPGIEKLNLRARYVFPIRFGPCRNEKRIVLAPDRKQRGLRLAEIFLEFRIELYVRRIVQEQIELNFFVTRALEEDCIQCVRLRRNTFRIGYPMNVLPARSSRGQNTLAEYVPILRRLFSPILSNWVPGVTEPFLVCIPVLRNDRGYPLPLCHPQPQPARPSPVKHVHPVP